TLTKLTNLVNALEAYVGLPQAIPQGATDGVATVVSPTQSGSSSITTPSTTAGVVVNPTDVNVPTLVTVYAVPETLLTNLPKYGPYYQFTSSSGTFNNAVLAGICTDAPSSLSNLQLAHNVPDPNPTNIQILPPASTSGLSLGCTPYLAMGPSLRNENLAVRGLRALERGLARLVSPAPLMAAASGTGVGGTTKNFSTFGVVQTGFGWSATNWTYLKLGPTTSSPDISAALSPSSVFSGPVQGAFSMVNPPDTYCSVYAATDTTIHSRVFGQDSMVAFKRTFVAPDGASTATMSFAIDNDMKVYVNGTDQTANVTPNGTLGANEAGFISHEGCPNQGDFSLSLTGLDSLSNTVTIIAVDRGGSTYFDASVTAASPPHP
ncbi:MAG TPA: hypothetical protein VMG41_04780, partial [Gemmatimonadales bacterium]|nr:hypothetical protein [Gemmatimonadales bacterium]